MNTPFYSWQFLWIIFTLLLPFSVFSQKNLLFEISGGAGTGWWTYNKGSAEDGSGHLGWDNTKTRGFMNTQGNLIFKIKKWNAGIGTNLSFFLENEMLAGDHSMSNYDKYSIAKKTVRFVQLYLLSEYDLYSGEKFLFSPGIKLGSFFIGTTHPRSDEFGFRILFEAGISNQILLAKNLFLVIRPFMQTMAIFGNDEARDGEKHQIYNFCLNAGLRYAFF